MLAFTGCARLRFLFLALLEHLPPKTPRKILIAVLPSVPSARCAVEFPDSVLLASVAVLSHAEVTDYRVADTEH